MTLFMSLCIVHVYYQGFNYALPAVADTAGDFLKREDVFTTPIMESFLLILKV